MAKSLIPQWTVAFVFLWCAPACPAQDAIAWTKDLRSALHSASREQKLVLLHFYSDDCRPCKSLERNVFSQPEVAAAIHKNFVPVKVNASEVPELAKHYNVNSWPTDLILTSAGQELYRAISPQVAATYVGMMDQIAFQAGVGAARLAGFAPPTTSEQNSVYSNVTLTGATAPMTTQPGAPANAAGVWDAAPRQNGQQQIAMNQYAGQGFPGAPARPDATQMPTGPAATSGDGQTSVYSAAATPPVHSGLPVDQPWPASVAAPPRPDSQASVYGPPAQPPHGIQGAGDPPAMQGQEARVTSHQALAPRMIERSKAPPIAMEGFCPVTILESLSLPKEDPRFRKWQKGDPRFGVVHRNRTYLFTSAQAQQKFLADPDRYAPILSGCDPVVLAETGKWVDGSSSWGVIMGDKMFLFANPQTLARFEKSPRTYTTPAYQAMAAEQGTLR